MTPGYDSVLKTIKGSHQFLDTPDSRAESKERRDNLVSLGQHYQQVRGLGVKVSEPSAGPAA